MWAGKLAEAELRIKLWVLTPSVPVVAPAHLHMDTCFGLDQCSDKQTACKGNFSNAIQMHSKTCAMIKFVNISFLLHFYFF